MDFLLFFAVDLFLSQFNELSLGILSCVYHVQNFIEIEGKLKKNGFIMVL